MTQSPLSRELPDRMGRELAIPLAGHRCHLAPAGRDAIELDKAQRLLPAAYTVIIGVLARRRYQR